MFFYGITILSTLFVNVHKKGHIVFYYFSFHKTPAFTDLYIIETAEIERVNDELGPGLDVLDSHPKIRLSDC